MQRAAPEGAGDEPDIHTIVDLLAAWRARAGSRAGASAAGAGQLDLLTGEIHATLDLDLQGRCATGRSSSRGRVAPPDRC